MFSPNNIVKQRRLEDEQRESERRLRSITEKYLGFFSKIRYDKLNYLIREITSKIESESGWLYINQEFQCRTDFHYNADYEEISYKTNRVSLKEKWIISKTGSKKEEKFIKRYKTLLETLISLEKKKERLVEPYQEDIMKEYRIPIIEDLFSII